MAAFNTITFNNATGSDTAASGCGPAVALTGTNASFAVLTVTLDGSPDLTDVAVDGTHLLWLKTSTGQQWFRIYGKDDGAKTVTLANVPAGVNTGRTWGIGGKRKTLNHADSRVLFTSGVTSDSVQVSSVIVLEDNQALTGAKIILAQHSKWTFKSDTPGTRRTITSNANACAFDYGEFLAFTDIQFTNTNATKTASVIYGNATPTAAIFLENCIINNSGGDYFRWPFYSENNITAINCYFYPGSTIFVDVESTAKALILRNCYFGSCLGEPVWAYRPETYIIENCIFDSPAFSATLSEQTDLKFFSLSNNIFYNGDASGFNWIGTGETSRAMLLFYNNIFINNTRYGIEVTEDLPFPNVIAINNNYYGNVLGETYQFVTGINDLALDPDFVNAAGLDFTVQNTSLLATGYPVGNFAADLTASPNSINYGPLNTIASTPVADVLSGAGLISLGVPATILSAAGDGDESAVYVLPTRSNQLTWQITGTVTEVDLLGSLDGQNWATLDTATTAGIRAIAVNVAFVKASVATGSNIGVLVIAKREKF